MTKKFGFVALFALSLIGCHEETVESEDIRTSGIWASFEVAATGNAKTTVKSLLKVGGGGVTATVIVLTGQDKLVCTSGETRKTLSKKGDYYAGTFSGEAGGTPFIFAFNRGDEDEAAPNSNVTLPDPFTISGVTSTQTVSRAAALDVTWEVATVAPADKTTWVLNGDCLFETDGTVPTDGALTLQGEDFHPDVSAEEAAKAGKTEEASCSAQLCIERKRNGVLDPAFAEEEGGKIYATQRRCIEFISTP